MNISNLGLEKFGIGSPGWFENECKFAMIYRFTVDIKW